MGKRLSVFLSLGNRFSRKTRLFSCSVKQLFASGAFSANNSIVTTATNGESTGISEHVTTSVHVALPCPITNRRIQIPARGRDCRHIQVYDCEVETADMLLEALWALMLLVLWLTKSIIVSICCFSIRPRSANCEKQCLRLCTGFVS